MTEDNRSTETLKAVASGKPSPVRQGPGQSAIRVAVVTNMPSGHNVDLFDSISQSEQLTIKVFYLTETTSGRSWKDRPSISHNHIVYRRWPKRSTYYWSKGAGRDIAAFAPDIVLINQYANLNMQVHARWARKIGVPVVLWAEPPGVQFAEVNPLRLETVRKLARRLALRAIRRNLSEIWAISNEGAHQYKIIAKGVDVVMIPYFGGITPKKTPDSVELWAQTKENPTRVVFAGKLIDRKGFDLFADAAERLLRTNDWSFEFQVVGTGTLEPIAVKMAKEWGARFKYLGSIERHEMDRVYDWAQVVVAPSRYDGWGMVVLEAASNGCAVVTTAKTGAAETVLGDAGAVVLESPSSLEIEQALLGLAADPLAREELSIRGRNLAGQMTASIGAEVVQRNVLRVLSSFSVRKSP